MRHPPNIGEAIFLDFRPLSEPNSLAIKLSGVPIILASSANEVVSEMQLPPTATHRVECAGATEGSKLRRRENI